MEKLLIFVDSPFSDIIGTLESLLLQGPLISTTWRHKIWLLYVVRTLKGLFKEGSFYVIAH